MSKKAKELDKNFVPDNGSMAPNMMDIKNLGKQMENLRTNEELEEVDKQPDPVQYQKEDT
ncbi:hypothetical protein JOC86_002874 [Bacillus pakistanensis]|uniref:Multidrug ABC transporter ATPase n=1 Tax=Rossellomorea pakistanensis TaxID=992288 RepID=A0ABS2NEN5_9BACI|nr:hypothetical protein [Bacillus pakistanensis]MBM7586322.1 hypothetical protein [Bacillus pakistanensis]